MDKKITYKIAIVLDEEKIKSVGDYTPESVYEAVDSYFAYFDIVQLKSDYTAEGKLLVYGCEENKYGKFWFAVLDLYNNEWFEPYLLKYKYYSNFNLPKGKWHKENVLAALLKSKVSGT